MFLRINISIHIYTLDHIYIYILHTIVSLSLLLIDDYDYSEYHIVVYVESYSRFFVEFHIENVRSLVV